MATPTYARTRLNWRPARAPRRESVVSTPGTASR